MRAKFTPTQFRAELLRVRDEFTCSTADRMLHCVPRFARAHLTKVQVRGEHGRAVHTRNITLHGVLTDWPSNERLQASARARLTRSPHLLQARVPRNLRQELQRIDFEPSRPCSGRRNRCWRWAWSIGRWTRQTRTPERREYFVWGTGLRADRKRIEQQIGANAAKFNTRLL